MKSMKKELGLQPYGELPSYSETILPREIGEKSNAREKESLDLQWAILQAACWNSGLDMGRYYQFERSRYRRYKNWGAQKTNMARAYIQGIATWLRKHFPSERTTSARSRNKQKIEKKNMDFRGCNHGVI